MNFDDTPHEAAFRAEARAVRHDIDRLAQAFGTSFEQTCHRLSHQKGRLSRTNRCRCQNPLRSQPLSPQQQPRLPGHRDPRRSQAAIEVRLARSGLRRFRMPHQQNRFHKSQTFCLWVVPNNTTARLCITARAATEIPRS